MAGVNSIHEVFGEASANHEHTLGQLLQTAFEIASLLGFGAF
jgi:hypothetical protein